MLRISLVCKMSHSFVVIFGMRQWVIPRGGGAALLDGKIPAGPVSVSVTVNDDAVRVRISEWIHRHVKVFVDTTSVLHVHELFSVVPRIDELQFRSGRIRWTHGPMPPRTHVRFVGCECEGYAPSLFPRQTQAWYDRELGDTARDMISRFREHFDNYSLNYMLTSDGDGICFYLTSVRSVNGTSATFQYVDWADIPSCIARVDDAAVVCLNNVEAGPIPLPACTTLHLHNMPGVDLKCAPQLQRLVSHGVHDPDLSGAPVSLSYIEIDMEESADVMERAAKTIAGARARGLAIRRYTFVSTRLVLSAGQTRALVDTIYAPPLAYPSILEVDSVDRRMLQRTRQIARTTVSYANILSTMPPRAAARFLELLCLCFSRLSHAPICAGAWEVVLEHLKK